MYKTYQSIKSNILTVLIPWIWDLDVFTIVIKDGKDWKEVMIYNMVKCTRVDNPRSIGWGWRQVFPLLPIVAVEIDGRVEWLIK